MCFFLVRLRPLWKKNITLSNEQKQEMPENVREPRDKTEDMLQAALRRACNSAKLF